jgi:hypothetical protein
LCQFCFLELELFIPALPACGYKGSYTEVRSCFAPVISSVPPTCLLVGRQGPLSTPAQLGYLREALGLIKCDNNSEFHYSVSADGERG